MVDFIVVVKRAAEDYIKEFKKKYDLDYTILRYGSLYGPKELTKIMESTK